VDASYGEDPNHLVSAPSGWVQSSPHRALDIFEIPRIVEDKPQQLPQPLGQSGNFRSFYAQDNFHAKANLTINAGLRWEINPLYNAGDKGQITGFDLTNGKLSAAKLFLEYPIANAAIGFRLFRPL
jgi:hypothetical protein